MPTAPTRYRQPNRRTESQQRGSPSARGYDRQWQVASKGFLLRNPLCCGYNPAGDHTPLCNRVATQVDHLEGFDGKYDPKFWDQLLWRARSASCHSRKTAMERQP